MKVINYTDLRLNLKHWLNSVYDDVEEVVIKRKNHQDIVLISLAEYNSLVETDYLLSGKNGEILRKSLAELDRGEKVYHDLIEE